MKEKNIRPKFPGTVCSHPYPKLHCTLSRIHPAEGLCKWSTVCLFRFCTEYHNPNNIRVHFGNDWYGRLSGYVYFDTQTPTNLYIRVECGPHLMPDIELGTMVFPARKAAQFEGIQLPTVDADTNCALRVVGLNAHRDISSVVGVQLFYKRPIQYKRKSSCANAVRSRMCRCWVTTWIYLIRIGTGFCRTCTILKDETLLTCWFKIIGVCIRKLREPHSKLL